MSAPDPAAATDALLRLGVPARGVELVGRAEDAIAVVRLDDEDAARLDDAGRARIAEALRRLGFRHVTLDLGPPAA